MTEADRFAELLSRVAREVTLRQAADVCCGDLTLEQFQTLQAVSASSDPLSIGALSARLRVALSTMSRNVSVLERNGYLLRARSAEDGRIVHVGISPKGKRALETLRCDERDVLADVYQRLPAGDRPRVVKALEVLRTCLDASNGARGGLLSADPAPKEPSGPLAPRSGERVRVRGSGPRPSLGRRVVAEGVGTAFLLATVIGSGIMAERLAGGNVALALLANTLATGAGLLALILTFGGVSGAHFNPAVSVADASQGGIAWRDVGAYVAAQLLGAFAGVALAHLMFDAPLFSASRHVRAGFGQLVGEFVATFGLIAVIRGSSRAGAA